MYGLKEHLPKSVTSFTEEILELESAIVLVLDKKVGVVGANSAFCDYLPFDSLSDFSKKHRDISELFIKTKTTLESDKPFAWLFTVLRNSRKKHKVKMLNKNGREQLFSVRVKEVSAEGKNLFIAQFDDISAFEKAKRAQMYFEEFKQKFLTSMSHEFRTPMNGIIGFASLLQDASSKEEQQEFIDIILKVVIIY